MTDRLQQLYLQLLKQNLLNQLYGGDLDLMADSPIGDPQPEAIEALKLTGRAWPSLALTMVGAPRLDHLQSCVETLLRDEIPGDLLEAGVWRGGASMLMKGVLKIHQDTERLLWVADSFQGLPVLNHNSHPLDKECSSLSYEKALEVPEHFVREAFQRLGLWDERVRLLPGWFDHSLLHPPMESLALLRLDCDYYVSTQIVLESLYTRLSPGAFVIVDDYGALPACRRAVDDFRAKHAIAEPLQRIDGCAVFWRTAMWKSP